jgi:pyruvate dehydrogenase E2 component (dihydrolipoamide acetyltransferase)
MGNLALRRKRRVSLFRKMAIGTWQTAYDPTVYGSIKLRMEPALAYLDEFRERTGVRLTLTHMMARAMGAVMQAMPDANAILRWNRIYLRERIGVFFQVALEDPQTGEIDLGGTTIYDPEQKSLEQIAEEFARTTGKVREGKDDKAKSRGLFRWIPYFALNRITKILSFLSYTLNLDLRWAGVPRDPFGSVMVTNIGSIGLDEAYAPLVPFSRVPIVVAMGAVRDEPVVEGGEVVPGKVMQICASFDHRVLDGVHATIMVKTLRAWFEDPQAHFGAIEARAAVV